MRNCYLLFCLCLPLSVFTQTAYYDAIRLTENGQDYKEFIRAIDEYKVESAANGVLVQFGQKEEEYILRQVHSFLQDPFSVTTSPSTYMQQVDTWLNEDPQWTYIQPAFQVTPKAILNNYQDTIYIFNKDQTVASPVTQQESIKMRFLEEQDRRLPKEEEVLIAVYNPTTRLFFEWVDGQFNPMPVAFFNGQQIYEGIPTIVPNHSRYYAFDVEDNQAYHKDTDHSYFNVIFKNKITDSITISVLNLIDEEGNFLMEDLLSAGSGMTTSSGSYAGSPVPAQGAVSFPSKAINAVAQFLVDRTKQELLLAFFDRFLEKMNQTTELQVLFPNTFYLLKTQDAFRLPSIGQLWVESFQGDVQNMLHNLEFLLTTDPSYAAIADHSSVRAFRLTNDLLRYYEEDISFTNILTQLQYKYSSTDDPISDNLDILTTLSKELIADEEGETMLTADQLMRLSYPTNEYFVALLYLNNQYSLNRLVLDSASDYSHLDYFQGSITPVIQNMVTLSSLLKNVKNKSSQYREKLVANNSEDSTDDTFFYFSQSIYKLLEFGFTTQYLFQPEQYLTSPAYRDCIPMIRNTIQATEDLQREELGIFIVHFSQLLEPIIAAKIAAKKEAPNNGSPKILKDIFFYSSFMVDVLSAQSTQQVNGILQQYALPVGSYRLKRQSKFNLSVNAYPGLHIGKEEGIDNSLNRANVLGITAPVGIAASWGKSRKKDGHAIGLFVPIIDVGAAFSYRWSGEATGFPEQLQWRQVLSPGAHLVWGIKNVPLSLMLGTQFTPQLRAVKENGAIGLEQNVWRYGISLVMDIPIFNLYVAE